MYNKEQEINHLIQQISLKKEQVKQAIREGAIFDEVKAITLQIKDLERRLGELQNHDQYNISNN